MMTRIVTLPKMTEVTFTPRQPDTNRGLVWEEESRAGKFALKGRAFGGAVNTEQSIAA
jgi:hypothetical protein